MRIPFIFLAFFACFSTFAQKDPSAKVILDQIGAKVKNSKGILVSIQMVSKNSQGKAMGTKQISLKMKGDKYSLKQGLMEILCDGLIISAPTRMC